MGSVLVCMLVCMLVCTLSCSELFGASDGVGAARSAVSSGVSSGVGGSGGDGGGSRSSSSSSSPSSRILLLASNLEGMQNLLKATENDKNFLVNTNNNNNNVNTNNDNNNSNNSNNLAKPSPSVTWIKSMKQLESVSPGSYHNVLVCVGSDSGNNLSANLLEALARVLGEGGSLYLRAKEKEVEYMDLPMEMQLSGFVDIRTRQSGSNLEIMGRIPGNIRMNLEPASQEAPPCDGNTNTRKACANCVCGRKEAEAAGTYKKVDIFNDKGELLPPRKGGCGSCSLGDGQRCEGCPYRGQPAFKVEGDKVVKLDV